MQEITAHPCEIFPTYGGQCLRILNSRNTQTPIVAAIRAGLRFWRIIKKKERRLNGVIPRNLRFFRTTLSLPPVSRVLFTIY